MKPLRWRSILVVALTLISIYSLIPTYYYLRESPELRNDAEHMAKVLPSWLGKTHLNLGLDLQGGVQLVLGVNLEQAVENRLGRMATEIGRMADEQKLGVKASYVIKGQARLKVEFADDANQEKFREEVKKNYFTLESVKREDKSTEYVFKSEQIASIKQSAIDQAERVVRSRVDKWGVTEPVITRRADGSILAQLPGFKDPQKAKELLGRTAQLKFKIVDEEFSAFKDLTDKLPPEVTVERGGTQLTLVSESKEAIVKLTEGKIPADRELMFSREAIAGGKKYKYRSLVVKAATEINGDDVLDASVTVDTNELDQQPAVQLKFTGTGGKRFADVTGANVGKRMAIVLDDYIESAPVIKTKIAGGTAVITLGSSQAYEKSIEEAQSLSMVLKSGALPATIEILEQRQVGASLGPELAREGVLGTVAGLALVYIYMLMYYRRPGLIAGVALALNAVYLLSLMAGFGFALTLPGIAGFVLSLGMAVDANVLINERIRQEIREGKPPRKAVDIGFKKVFWTVFDGHVTTLLAGFILLSSNASGPIRGFAVAMVIGLIVSLFTSLYCSHLFFDIVMARSKSEKETRNWIGADRAMKHKSFNFNFLKHDVMNTTIAIVLSVVVIGIASVRGLNWSVDFVGGTEVEVGFNKAIDPERLHEEAKKIGIPEMTVQGVGEGKNQFLLRFDDRAHAEAQTTEDKAKAAAAGGRLVQDLQEAFNRDLADYQPQFRRVDFVGPQVGKELRNQGFLSVFYVIAGIMIYLALRFDFRFGSGTVLKLIPDACMMLGFYLFFNRSFDLTSVAALLTGIGYSVNDVIVVYDRIRENLQTHPRRTLRENINVSLNETLTRTINTSVATSLSLIGILIFGSGAIWNFAMAMLIGIVVATLTSNLVGSSYLIWIDKVLRKRGKLSEGGQVMRPSPASGK